MDHQTLRQGPSNTFRIMTAGGAETEAAWSMLDDDARGEQIKYRSAGTTASPRMPSRRGPLSDSGFPCRRFCGIFRS